MQSFQDTFETRKRSFISAFSIYMTVPLSGFTKDVFQAVKSSEFSNMYH